MTKAKKPIAKKPILLFVTALVILAAAFGIYVLDCYRADESSRKALKSDESVTVTETDYGWFFDGPSQDTALIYYPGAKVETVSYAPFLHKLADRGMDVCLVDMPFHLAIFNPNAASVPMAAYSYDNWYIGGHSLGGAMAASYASNHADALSGLILCAAYPTSPLEADLVEILVYGSEDHVVNREKIQQGRQYAPDTYVEEVIDGGNHAQFGNYGDQRGDGNARITADEQQDAAVEIIINCINF